MRFQATATIILPTVIVLALSAISAPAFADTRPAYEGKRYKSVMHKKDHAAAKESGTSSSAYTKWKMHLAFWPRKGWLLGELVLTIAVGIIIGQMLEVAGWIRCLSVAAWPLLRLGRLPPAAGPPFIVAFQSGAAANAMIRSYQEQNLLTRRELCASILVVSALSLFAHLPSFVVPLGITLGWDATIAFFSVRVAAIVLTISGVLVVSRMFSSRLTYEADAAANPVPVNSDMPNNPQKPKGRFWVAVATSSWRTLRRLILYVVPTFALMAVIERCGVLERLGDQMPGLFSLAFLPPQTAVVVPAQAVNLYNGAVVAGNFVNEGVLTARQAVVILLIGSVLTAPLRTLRHALPTYVGILGAKAGTTLAVSAQVLRCLSVILCAYILTLIWR